MKIGDFDLHVLGLQTRIFVLTIQLIQILPYDLALKLKNIVLFLVNVTTLNF